MAKNKNPNDIENITVNKSKKIALKILLIFLIIILAVLVGIAAGIIKEKWIK